ncbi:MAG TPA: class IV adenylate cyclase [Burkholderiaceae bacterium]
MARNIEIKARVASLDALMPKARAVAPSDAELIEQDDTFFRVPHGRLKLREFADGSAELIHYHRADTVEAKLSDYRRVPVPDAAALREALERALGLLGRVRKQRWLLLAGQTRIHLDRVEGLGDFMELEVVLRADQTEADGVRIADQLMHELGLTDTERIAGAYLDLLAGANA